MTSYCLAASAICVVLAMAAPAQCNDKATGAEALLFPASALRAALRGETFNHLGVIRNGEKAEAFAQGYIAALSDMADRQGAWCGAARILPNEVIARVYDHLTDMGAAAEDISADVAGLTALEAIAPCHPH